MPICIKCNIDKPESSFRKKIDNRVKMTKPFYLSHTCTSCINKKYAKKQKETSAQREKKYWGKQREMVSDKWVIKVILSDHRLKGMPIKRIDITEDMIELKKAKILIRRLKDGVEKISGNGVCKKCKKLVPLSDFSRREKTEKRRGYLIRICKTCKHKKHE